MNVKSTVAILTGALGLAILVVSLLYLYESFVLPIDRLGPVKDAFDLAISKVLLPMFTTLVTAVLTYIFGKQLVSAISGRILANATNTRVAKTPNESIST